VETRESEIDSENKKELQVQYTFPFIQLSKPLSLTGIFSFMY